MKKRDLVRQLTSAGFELAREEEYKNECISSLHLPHGIHTGPLWL